MKEPFKTLAKWERVAFDNEPGFLEYFSEGGFMLSKISWTSEDMYFNYIIDSGQHVTHAVSIKEWLEFYERNK